TLTTEALIVPGVQQISFALVDRKDVEWDQLLLVGTSKRAKDISSRFSISGVYDLGDGTEAPGILSASLTSFEYHEDGSPNLIHYGDVLLESGSYFIDADVNEPRVGKLTISRGSDFVWSTPLVMEPGGTVTVARRRGSGNWLVASSEGGRHARLYDSWHLSEKFTELGEAAVSAAGSKRMSLIVEAEKLRISALRDIAMRLDDPIDSLIALELAREELVPNLFNKAEKVQLYDKLATMLDEDFVARRVAFPRDRLVKNSARSANNERLVPGQTAPAFTLANLLGEEISLKDVLDDVEIVLIDFWASWCGPCIVKFPELKRLHTKYQEDGFEIVTISLDTSEEDWRRSSKEIELPWFDLGDMNGFFGSTAVSYGVSNVPANYVLDGDMRIVAKNIDLKQMEELLVARLDLESNLSEAEM
ncbi:MAG: TlpA disulfide reductase family protein, partial [Gammaproteobacteria bacterium]|nr:TlpA disulfide reductase family protein [Gammaproteobacteria bacterium]